MEHQEPNRLVMLYNRGCEDALLALNLQGDFHPPPDAPSGSLGYAAYLNGYRTTLQKHRRKHVTAHQTPAPYPTPTTDSGSGSSSGNTKD